MRDEEIWNYDLIHILNDELKKEFPKIKIMKGKVLKDIFLNKDKNTSEYKIQFGFVDQDIVFYEEIMDISEFHSLNKLLVHNNSENKNQMVIPKLICELKFDGITSHGLITYSEYSSDIKSIFPESKYWLVMRYKKSSSENKLFRHGRNFDKILYFDEGKSDKRYKEGDFQNELKSNTKLKNRFEEFIDELKNTLRKKESNFIK